MPQFNLAGLAAYTDQVSGELMTRTLLQGNTMSKPGIMKNPGIKSAKNLNILTSSLTAASGVGCGFTDAGSTTYTVVPLATAAVKIERDFCLNSLETKWLQVGMNPGSYPEDLPFEDILTLEQSELVSRLIDTQLWIGDSVVNGILDAIDAASATTINVSKTGFTSTTAIAKVDEYAALIPAEVRGAANVALYLSFAEFDKYLINMRQANYYHFAPDFNTADGVTHPGMDNLKVIPVMGLAGSTRKVIAADGNINIGFDNELDSSEFQRWYSMDNQSLRFRIRYKLGAAIAFPTQLVNIN